jgi:hypothetical protein
MIVVLLSSLLGLSCALPTTPDTLDGPILSTSEPLLSSLWQWSLEDIKFLRNLLPLDEEIPSRFKTIKADGKYSKPAPLELPFAIPIMDTSSTITTPPSFFDITSSRRILLDNIEADSSVSAWSASGALEPTPIAMKSIPKASNAGRKKVVSKTHAMLKYAHLSPPTFSYARLGTTVFDVWREWKFSLMVGPNSPRQFKPEKSHLSSMKIIVDELKSRMNDANRTIEEALGDLEEARLKMVARGGSRGSIAFLVRAIRVKNGMRIDPRLKNYLPLEYKM